MKILFTRHGESLANTLHIISNRDLPHPLTEQGRAQAAALAEKLAGRPIARIYASPVLRARETAEIISRQLNIPLEITDALKEYDCGSLEGRGDETAWAAHQQFVRDWLAGQNRDQSPEGGETFFEIRRRLADFVGGLVVQYNESESEILCVSHGGTYAFGLPGLLINLDFDFFRNHGLDHTEIVTAECIDDGLICRSWGEHTFA